MEAIEVYWGRNDGRTQCRPITSAPTHPMVGDLFHELDSQILYVYTGSEWAVVTSVSVE